MTEQKEIDFTCPQCKKECKENDKVNLLLAESCLIHDACVKAYVKAQEGIKNDKKE